MQRRNVWKWRESPADLYLLVLELSMDELSLKLSFCHAELEEN
ncbi:hypothetical protein [Nitrosomonas supralitoralis]|nr:hypothetical protein [Nitrosomonas supralitoralis]